MDSTRRPACSVRCPANCIRLLITVRILRRCIFFRPGASFFFNDSCPIKDAYVFRCIVAGIQPDEQWFFRQLSAQFNGLSQEIRSFFLAVLFPNPQFKIDEVSFRADICHNWCISVKTLVGTGYAFLIGFRIVKGVTSISTGTKPLSRAVGSMCISRSMSTFACWMSLRRVDFFNKTAFSKYLPYEYQTTGSNEPLIAEFNVYFLHCTASACLLILSLHRIMHDDTVKKTKFCLTWWVK